MWGTTARALGIGVLLLSLGVPTTARAERILLLPAGGSADLDREAGRVLERLLGALERQGHAVRTAVEREVELASAVLGCDTRACAQSGLMALDVDVVVAPALWRRADGHRELAVTALGTRGVPFDVLQPVDAGADRTAVEAVASALVARLDALAADDDGQRREGAASAHERTSTGASGPALLGDRSTRPRSGANVALGLGLAVVGLAPLSLGGISLARRGECAAPTQTGLCPYDESGRYRVYDFGPRSAVLLGGGAAAVITGAVLMIARPIRMRPVVDVGPHAARVGFSLAY